METIMEESFPPKTNIRELKFIKDLKRSRVQYLHSMKASNV